MRMPASNSVMLLVILLDSSVGSHDFALCQYVTVHGEFQLTLGGCPREVQGDVEGV